MATTLNLWSTISACSLAASKAVDQVCFSLEASDSSRADRSKQRRQNHGVQRLNGTVSGDLWADQLL